MKPIAIALLVFVCVASSVSTAQVDDSGWVAQGPGPAMGGQVENVSPNDHVVGAVQALVPHPADPEILYAGAVNGGIWKTANATATFPNWSRLTDHIGSLSIGALEMDPTDPNFETLVAGIGRYSSYGRRGGDRIGLLKTTDGGENWTVIDGGGVLAGKNISGVAARGDVIVVSVDSSDSGASALHQFGIYRSVDGGNTFRQISNGNGAATGLPQGRTHDLAGDPSNSERLYTSVVAAGAFGGVNGVYRSDDTGASWFKVSDAAMDALIDDDVSNLEVAVGGGGGIFAGIVGSGRLSGVFRSGDGGATWTAMDLPATIENGGVPFGIHPGGQGSIHFSMSADPVEPQIVYIGGDRQPRANEDGGGGLQWPNSIGAGDYSGRLFRGDASRPPGSQWTPLTHSGTASNSSPHADSRDMAFDAAGNLIEVDDGGVYRRTSPRTAAGDWFSINGDLQSTEYHGIAFDAVSGIIIGGAQDTGTTEQVIPDQATFRSVSTADGGDVTVDDHSTPGLSTRYSSFQFLQVFRRREFNSANVLQSQTFPAHTVIGGGEPFSAQFYTPIAVNAEDGDRLIIGGANSVYESLDRGDTMSEIGPGIVVNGLAGDPIVYGVPGNADLLYVASGNTIFRRAISGGALFPVTSPSGSAISDLAVDPNVPDRIFAVDSDAVYFSANAGSSWTSINGDLTVLEPGRLRTLAFLPGVDDALVVGADRGIFAARDSDGFAVWTELAGNLPNAPVYELEYNAATAVLVAGLLGRGAWKLLPGPPRAAIDPVPLDWGPQPVGTPVQMPLTLSNNGEAPLSVQSVEAASAPFEGPVFDPACPDGGQLPFTLQPGGSCTANFVFSNVAGAPVLGEVEQFLEVVTDDPDSPGQIGLLAEGISPRLALTPTGLDFGVQRVGGDSAPQEVSFENTGTGAVTVGPFEGDPSGQFRRSGGSCPQTGLGYDLPPGDSCTVEFTFTPADGGAAEWEMNVAHNGVPGSDHLVTLRGTGAHAVIDLDPAAIDFGGVPVGNSVTAALSIANTGEHFDVTVSDFDTLGLLPAEVSVAPGSCSAFPFALDPGESCELEITFAPSGLITFAAPARLDHDATDGTWNYLVQGQGVSGEVFEDRFETQ